MSTQTAAFLKITTGKFPFLYSKNFIWIKKIIIYRYITYAHTHQPIGLEGRVFANGLEDCDSIPEIQSDQKKKKKKKRKNNKGI